MRWICSVGVIGAVLSTVAFMNGGCTTVTRLQQPTRVPVYVESYDNSAVKSRCKGVSCWLNLSNCPEYCTMTEIGFSGSRSAGPAFPLRPILDDEFGAVISSNFCKTKERGMAKLEVCVGVGKALLVREGKELTFQVVLDVRIRNSEGSEQSSFCKRYEVKTFCRQTDETLVPGCVYEAIQNLADKFIRDLGGETAIVNQMGSLAS